MIWNSFIKATCSYFRVVTLSKHIQKLPPVRKIETLQSGATKVAKENSPAGQAVTSAGENSAGKTVSTSQSGNPSGRFFFAVSEAHEKDEHWELREKTVIEFAPSVIASIYLVNDEQQKSPFFRCWDHRVVKSFFFYFWVLAADCRRGHTGVSKVEIWRRRVGTAQVEQKTCEANFHAMFERFFNLVNTL